ncbi:MAG: sigma-70 family RNA polymerase sigma factor [Pirellulaceae bacterium]|nr:sigma-70 family RNA polymerase sigma factor [Pirellulaceae bacterium]
MQTSQATGRGAWPTTQITLLRQVADGQDQRAWDSFAGTYAPLILGYCRKRGMQEADALDVVQEVLLQVSRQMGQFQYDARRGRFRGWLGTVTHRAMLRQRERLRRRARSASGCADDDSLSRQECDQPLGELWVEAFNAHVYREAVQRVRLQITDETWRAFEGTFVQGVPPRKVAEELGRSVGWVYQAKAQVVCGLKSEILYLAEDSVLLSRAAIA